MDEELNRILTNSDVDIIQSTRNYDKKVFNRHEFDLYVYIPIFKKYINYIIVDTLVGECSICLESVKKNDKIYKLNCGHIFHIDCLNKWNKNTCPYCRSNIYR
jgi:hypothetical protein